MTTIQTRRPTLQSQLSAFARFATAVAVATVLALTWIGAEQASRQAVNSAATAFSGGAGSATPTVQTARSREAGGVKRL